MKGAGTTREGSASNYGEITAPLAEGQPTAVLDQVDLRLLADFFLLLHEWDTLQSTRTLVEPSPIKRVAA